MSTSRKLLILGGTVLAALGMLYGLLYAVFVEHQTLDRMGGTLAGAFTYAAEGHQEGSEARLMIYREIRFDYVRQVDVHSHWIGLAMLMIMLGAAFDEVTLPERTRLWIAVAMLTGSVIFPFGVLLQTVKHEAAWTVSGSVLAVAGSGLVIIALAATALGFMRGGAA